MNEQVNEQTTVDTFALNERNKSTILIRIFWYRCGKMSVAHSIDICKKAPNCLCNQMKLKQEVKLHTLKRRA